jgi:hypothetical protein
VKRIQKQTNKQSSDKVSINISNDDAVQKQMNISKGIPQITWKEKVQFLTGALTGKESELVQTMDVVNEFLDVSQDIGSQDLDTIAK